MARNRFALDQASDRAGPLGWPIEADGRQRPVHVYFFAYAGSAGHRNLTYNATTSPARIPVSRSSVSIRR